MTIKNIYIKTKLLLFFYFALHSKLDNVGHPTVNIFIIALNLLSLS